MKLSNRSPVTTQRKKRLGRGLGSGKGAKSGRGTTRHQKARENIPLHFEGGANRFTKKFPLLRGKGKNKSIQDKPLVIDLDTLNVFEDSDRVTKETLVEKGILKKDEQKKNIKVLSNGSLEKKLTICVPVSQTARAEIEKKGGTIEV